VRRAGRRARPAATRRRPARPDVRRELVGKHRRQRQRSGQARERGTRCDREGECACRECERDAGQFLARQRRHIEQQLTERRRDRKPREPAQRDRYIGPQRTQCGADRRPSEQVARELPRLERSGVDEMPQEREIAADRADVEREAPRRERHRHPGCRAQHDRRPQGRRDGRRQRRTRPCRSHQANGCGQGHQSGQAAGGVRRPVVPRGHAPRQARLKQLHRQREGCNRRERDAQREHAGAKRRSKRRGQQAQRQIGGQVGQPVAARQVAALLRQRGHARARGRTAERLVRNECEVRDQRDGDRGARALSRRHAPCAGIRPATRGRPR